MKIIRFEDLIAWQKAQDLAVLIYKEFTPIKDYSFKDQICRASVSISNNIAEGFDRRSNAEWSRFLLIALASCSEVRSMLYLSVRIGYITPIVQENLLMQTSEISKVITGLVKAIRKK